MITVRRRMRADPDDVWRVLADGWLYPLFVVGASRIREVDPTWPAVGSRLHHSVGAWPLLLDDDTEVVECREHERLVLSARGWPLGRARVEVELAAATTVTEVVLSEDAEAGPGRLVPQPFRQLPIAWRNTETLRRLAYLAERREHRDDGGPPA